ncbi:hypothetical protein J4E85_008976 [Alternaria conjuncta]|uniref:uncharacterized protein n=1 Tax=Alternaria conjuncta TaxID=181017 RepID=UPI0022201126|nr:uncharacterized protein J4E85_008976 [Alternaria conjuncta]KAI4920861.1 hypothetical protein J4E85_008976 [Alternaria conjuncta]
MMTESFKNLAKSTSLLNIYLCEATTYPAVLAALNLASFPRQIIHVLVNPKDYQISSHNHFLNPLAESPHLISHLEFQATLHKDPWDIEPDMRRVDVAHNEFGRHYSGYKSVTPQVSKLAAKLSSVKEVSFRGCDTVPRLRLCHGCEDAWVGIFAKNTYSNLTHLDLCGGYVSGSRLRGFLKRHSGTLQHVMFDFVSLTDGNWCSIAKGLQKCPNLNYLDVGPDTTTGRYIGSLLQRHASSPLAISLPKKYVTPGLEASKLQSDDSHIDVILRNTKDVAHWLDVFVRYFATDKSIAGDCYEAFNGYKLPVYHEAPLDKYLEADEEA